MIHPTAIIYPNVIIEPGVYIGPYCIIGAPAEWKGYALSAAAWAAGGSLSTARNGLAGCGTQTEAAAFGGFSTVNTTATEEYNGTSWTAGGNIHGKRNT